ncbi:MAG: Na(+)-translocating NADH-quinone reductase subunit A [Muribaculaceae bacterium]|nr:Na(+)-translocating NADH-quinone reductase subunit A [Muribaculaceae bacterium]
MPEKIKIKKGLDIPLFGQPTDKISVDTTSHIFAIYPDDFPGVVWKSAVKAGDTVKPGDILFQDKASGKICLVAPVGGEIKEINRGERRHINFISIESKASDSKGDRSPFEKPSEDAVQLKEALQRSGLWAMMRQRPYDIVPEADKEPRDIFVTAFDTAPLAGNIITEADKEWLEKGLKALSLLTKGKVYLDIRYGQNIDSKVAVVTSFEGPHPAGNVGTQIAAIKPVNKGETVWALDARTAVRIGKLTEGIADFETLVAVTGPEVKDPHLVKSIVGASIEGILKGNVEDYKGKRIISGNVLTGVKVSQDGFLRYPYRQITVIAEGDDADEFMGWASLNPGKFSVKRTFPAFLRGLSKPFNFDARIKGGQRAMILSGEYDKVFPFDIYPEYLLKAIIARDIDRMEKLGIYEVAPEDFALPEFVDTSKQELQKTVREGLDYLRKELE